MLSEHARIAVLTQELHLLVLVCALSFSSFLQQNYDAVSFKAIKRCVILSNPANGRVRQNGVLVGSQATYICDRGFTLVGSSGRICQANGQWSGEAPICKGE